MLHHVKYTAVSMLQTSTQDSASHLTTLVVHTRHYITSNNTHVVHTRHYIISDNTYTCPHKTLHHIGHLYTLSTHDTVSHQTTLTCCPHKTLYHIGQHLHVVHTRHCIVSDNLHVVHTRHCIIYDNTYTCADRIAFMDMHVVHNGGTFLALVWSISLLYELLTSIQSVCHHVHPTLHPSHCPL